MFLKKVSSYLRNEIPNLVFSLFSFLLTNKQKNVIISFPSIYYLPSSTSSRSNFGGSPITRVHVICATTSKYIHCKLYSCNVFLTLKDKLIHILLIYNVILMYFVPTKKLGRGKYRCATAYYILLTCITKLLCNI